MSLQVQIMLILSGHPDGRATLAAMKADLAVLAGAGPGWTQRIKRLASNAPGLDIFTEGFVVRDASGWQISEAGRLALRRMDSISPALPDPPVAVKPAIAIVARRASAPLPSSPAKLIHITERRRLPLRAM